MSPTVSLSARVSPQVRNRLAAEARAQGLPLATYAARVLSAASPDGAKPGDGAVQAEVEAAFDGLAPEASLNKAVCLALARTCEGGGTAGIAAGKELLIEVRWAESRYGPDDEDDGESGP